MFTALELPDPVRAGLARWLAGGLSDPALRPMHADALHITLCFLGATQEREIEAVGSVLRSVPARPVELSLDAEASPVPKGRPSLYAIGARGPAVMSLQAELAEALVQRGLLEPEERAFWPHLTVARVRSERRPPERGQRRGKSRPRRVSEPPEALPDALTEPFGAVRMALYRSILKPQGATHVRLDGVDLPSA